MMMSTIIPRNTSIPIEKTERYVTSADNQRSIRVQVLQGEAERCADNHKIDETSIGNITPGPKGTEKIDVTFKIDANGLFQADIRDVRTGNSESLSITADRMNLPQEEIRRLAEIAEFDRGQAARRRNIQEQEAMAIEAG